MARRVVSLWLPRFGTERLAQARPHPTRSGAIRSERAVDPLAVAVSLGGRRLVLAVNAAAEAAGVCPGLTLADARALLPGLAVADHDPVAEGRVLDRLAEAAERYTPWTRVDHGEEGAGAGLWLDITGVAHLFGGEEMLLTDLLARLACRGWTARAAVADTGPAAWAVARHATDIARPFVIVPEEGATAALAPLPVAALRLPPVDAEALARLGLRRIGDLLSLPRPSLARRFGPLPGRRLDEALGRRRAPLSPRRPVAPHHARQIFAEPILEAEAIAAALRRLVAALAQGLARRAEGARRLELACHRVDDSVCRLAVGTGHPSRDPDHLCRLFTEHLGRVDPGFGIEVLVVSAPVVEPLGALQLGFAEVAAGGPGDGLDALLTVSPTGWAGRRSSASNRAQAMCRSAPRRWFGRRWFRLRGHRFASAR